MAFKGRSTFFPGRELVAGWGELCFLCMVLMGVYAAVVWLFGCLVVMLMLCWCYVDCCMCFSSVFLFLFS